MLPAPSKPIAAYPDRLTAAHLAEIWGVSVKRIYAMDAEGMFVFAELKPRIGRKAWSKDRIAAYLRGEQVGLASGQQKRAS